MAAASVPQRSQVIRMNHDGNAASGSSSASRPVGNGSSLAAPVALWDRSRGHGFFGSAAILRFISRNSALVQGRSLGRRWTREEC